MTTRSAGTITLAEGHTIESAAVRKRRRLLDDLPIKAALGRAKAAASVDARTELLGVSRFDSMVILDACHTAAVRKDWTAADRLVLDALAQDRAAYARVLDAEAWMLAFSGRLCAEVRTARAAFRWRDAPELESYLGGTFESRVEDNQKRRGFKALTMNPNLKFLLRKVTMAVPLTRDMRKCIKCVRYTALPRLVKVEDERIADAMTAANVDEAEIRVPDGTPVPAGTTFAVGRDARVDGRVIAMLKELYTVKH